MKKEKISAFSVFDRMVNDDNQGIQMATTIIKSEKVPQGYLLTFGVMDNIGKDAYSQLLGLPGEYALFCLAVKKTEIEKTRKMMEKEMNSEEVKENLLTSCSHKNCNEPVYEFGVCFKHYCIEEHK